MSATDTAAQSLPAEQRRAEAGLLARILPTRLLVNAQFRLVYPFLPAIARGLGVPLETAALLVAFRAAFGAISPLFGLLADRIGRKPLMVAGVAALALGAAVVALGQGFGVVLLGFGLLGVSQSAYDPAMQAHVSDAVPQERLGRALGIVELSWAGSWLIGVPATGFLMARWGWQSPFVVIAGLGLLCILLTLTVREVRSPATTRLRSGSDAELAAAMSRSEPSGKPSEDDRVRSKGVGVHGAVLPRPVIFALAASSLILFANESLFIVYGALMEQRFGLTLGALGVASIAVSLAELVGASAVVALADRLGKRRSLIVGLLFNAACFALLPFTGAVLPIALTGLAVVALTSEFSIVTSIPLLSGLADRSRGLVMALRTALMWGMVIVASFVAPRLWDAFGLPAVAATSAASALLAALLVWRGIRSDTLSP